MSTSKLFARESPNIMIIKAVKEKAFLQPFVRKVKTAFRRCQPQHWFDGFMDGVTIELKDLK